VLICHVVDYHDAGRPLVIRVSQGAELHLSCCVPDGHPDLAVEVDDVFLFVVDARCSYQITLEDAFRVTVQNAALADTGVAEQRDLDGVVGPSHLRLCGRRSF